MEQWSLPESERMENKMLVDEKMREDSLLHPK
jgi:hypothetical protein